MAAKTDVYDPKNSVITETTLGHWLRCPVSGDITEVPGIASANRNILSDGTALNTNTYDIYARCVSTWFKSTCLFLLFYWSVPSASYPAGIDTTYQLIGKFLTFKASDDVREHMNAFQSWLKQVGVNAKRTTITHALAEKCDIFMPGTYDATLWD